MIRCQMKLLNVRFNINIYENLMIWNIIFYYIFIFVEFQKMNHELSRIKKVVLISQFCEKNHYSGYI